MINLDEKYISQIKNIISAYLDEYNLYLFGSRANGNAKQYSDIDIAISSKKITSEIKNKIEFDFENSTIPYKIDFVDLNNISVEFKNQIKNFLIKI